MTFAFSLQKVLELKEYDKKIADEACTQATREFEEVATSLYHLMKKKETLQEEYHQALETGTSISRLRLYETNLQSMDKLIYLGQKDTHKARLKMQTSEQRLTSRALDVKKYEKVKEKRKHDYDEKRKADDQKAMDEIAVQQFSWK
ncbi:MULTISPECIES: flagellar export protein FliJ [Alteribacter]|uniref:Flagellar FliJ protein n=1 Tax=Alteribacter keqinensis TaxID=2483800 RepID=A0A3M7TVU1_9BACI|nr:MULTISPECIES: flagellar export protein FliJ [Alteribacter]MBM7094174.1 flagellar export protein FliJ [Alteribacter salitolerans]RNA69593.1 flagellar export protein FliJ [Alteribacter keqinensis]